MIRRPGLERVVTDWLHADATNAGSDRVLAAALARVPAVSQERRRPWALPRMNTAAKFAVTTVAVVAVAAGGVYLLPADRGGLPGGGPAASPSPSPSATERADIIGLPPEGATPSDPRRSELMVLLGGSLPNPPGVNWVFADGRFVWHRWGGSPPAGAEGSIGLFEQRLTPDGVEYLRAELLSSGLFESDLSLAKAIGTEGVFVEIHVRNEDRLVRATWASREWGQVGPGAPEATPEQARALGAAARLLTATWSWPASVWADESIKPYVPSQYAVCLRRFPNLADLARTVELLPKGVRDFLDATDQATPEESLSEPGCSRLATDEARVLVWILEDAGIQRSGPLSSSWLRHIYRDAGGHEVWINFEPVLPDGAHAFLGPG